MIYLATLGKRFGPFSADELEQVRHGDYSWILDLREKEPRWRPLDQQPGSAASPHDAPRCEVLAFSLRSGRAVSGVLEKVRIRSGTLVTDESLVRLEPGTTVRIQIAGKNSFPATIEQVDYCERKTSYRLSWLPVDAPG